MSRRRAPIALICRPAARWSEREDDGDGRIVASGQRRERLDIYRGMYRAERANCRVQGLHDTWDSL